MTHFAICKAGYYCTQAGKVKLREQTKLSMASVLISASLAFELVVSENNMKDTHWAMRHSWKMPVPATNTLTLNRYQFLGTITREYLQAEDVISVQVDMWPEQKSGI